MHPLHVVSVRGWMAQSIGRPADKSSFKSRRQAGSPLCSGNDGPTFYCRQRSLFKPTLFTWSQYCNWQEGSSDPVHAMFRHRPRLGTLWLWADRWQEFAEKLIQWDTLWVLRSQNSLVIQPIIKCGWQYFLTGFHGFELRISGLDLKSLLMMGPTRKDRVRYSLQP